MFRALHLEENKKIIQPAIFGFSRWLPFEGEKRNLSKWFSFDLSQCLPDGREILKPFIKTAFSCSTTWGRKLLTAKARFLVILVAYLLRKEKIFKRLNFRFFSWSTPWGRKFRSRHNFWPLPVETSEGIFKTGVKKLASRCLLFEGRKFFWEWLPKRPLSVGISEEKIIPWNPHISNFLAGYSLGEQNFFENTY